MLVGRRKVESCASSGEPSRITVVSSVAPADAVVFQCSHSLGSDKKKLGQTGTKRTNKRSLRFNSGQEYNLSPRKAITKYKVLGALSAG